MKLPAPHTPRIACCSGSTRSSLTTSIRMATDGSAREKPAMNQTAGSTWWLRRRQNLALPRIGARRAAKRPRLEVNCGRRSITFARPRIGGLCLRNFENRSRTCQVLCYHPSANCTRGFPRVGHYSSVACGGLRAVCLLLQCERASNASQPSWRGAWHCSSGEPGTSAMVHQMPRSLDDRNNSKRARPDQAPLG